MSNPSHHILDMDSLLLLRFNPPTAVQASAGRSCPYWCQ